MSHYACNTCWPGAPDCLTNLGTKVSVFMNPCCRCGGDATRFVQTDQSQAREVNSEYCKVDPVDCVEQSSP